MRAMGIGKKGMIIKLRERKSEEKTEQRMTYPHTENKLYHLTFIICGDVRHQTSSQRNFRATDRTCANNSTVQHI